MIPLLLKLFKTDIDTRKLICFTDAAHGNNLQNRCSTTHLVFTFMGGAIIYKSKTQSITAVCSTKAKFVAVHTAAKHTRYL